MSLRHLKKMCSSLWLALWMVSQYTQVTEATGPSVSETFGVGKMQIRSAGNSVKAAKVSGDVIVGGLFSIHNRQQSTAVQTCGRLNEQVGIHRLEAMLYAIDRVNKDRSILPNITLGADIRDDCETINTAMEHSLSFILGAVENGNHMCNVDGERKQKKHLVGVIGPSYSFVAVPVASLLRLFYVPQVSYAATSSELSDKNRFEYFVRTVPPDPYQAKAMVNIIQFMNWTAVFAVNSRGTYGERGMAKFKELARKANICIAYGNQQLEREMVAEDYNNLLKKLRKENAVRVIVLFCETRDLTMILEAAKNLKFNSNLIWLASDFWGTRFSHLEGLERIANGAITLDLHTSQDTLKPFYEYFSSLLPENNTRNPWFKEYWEEYMKCNIKNVTDTQFETRCNTSRVNSILRYDAKVSFVIDAVYVFAHALHDMQQAVCANEVGMCDRMRETINGKNFLGYLRRVSFNGTSGHVSFDHNGDSAGRYDINILQDNKYTNIGTWSNGKLLKLKTSDIIKENQLKGTLESQCGKPCPLGSIKRTHDAECCWTCEPCRHREFLADEYTCKKCNRSQHPNATFTGCDLLPLSYISATWVTVISSLGAIGVLTTLFISGVFICFRNTALVMASGRELSAVLLAGVMMCYCLAFTVLAKPSPQACAVQRLWLSLCYCICNASLLVKTNRIARIFSGEKSVSFISPQSQLLITAAIVAPALAVSSTSLVLSPPNVDFSYDYKDYVVIKCNIMTEGLIVVFAYNVLLVLLCSIYAFRTRKTPVNFNEAKYIGFSTYTMCVIWIAFLPVYFSTNSNYQVLTLCFSSILSATTVVVFLFIPKVYIILITPEKNIRSNSRFRSKSGDLSGFSSTLDSQDLDSEKLFIRGMKHSTSSTPSAMAILQEDIELKDTPQDDEVKHYSVTQI